MIGEPIESSGPRHCLEVSWSCKECIVSEAVIEKMKACPTLKNVKEVQGICRTGNQGNKLPLRRQKC